MANTDAIVNTANIEPLIRANSEEEALYHIKGSADAPVNNLRVYGSTGFTNDNKVMASITKLVVVAADDLEDPMQGNRQDIDNITLPVPLNGFIFNGETYADYFDLAAGECVMQIGKIHIGNGRATQVGHGESSALFLFPNSAMVRKPGLTPVLSNFFARDEGILTGDTPYTCCECEEGVYYRLSLNDNPGEWWSEHEDVLVYYIYEDESIAGREWLFHKEVDAEVLEKVRTLKTYEDNTYVGILGALTDANESTVQCFVQYDIDYVHKEIISPYKDGSRKSSYLLDSTLVRIANALAKLSGESIDISVESDPEPYKDGKRKSTYALDSTGILIAEKLEKLAKDGLSNIPPYATSSVLLPFDINFDRNEIYRIHSSYGYGTERKKRYGVVADTYYIANGLYTIGPHADVIDWIISGTSTQYTKSELLDIIGPHFDPVTYSVSVCNIYADPDIVSSPEDYDLVTLGGWTMDDYGDRGFIAVIINTGIESEHLVFNAYGDMAGSKNVPYATVLVLNDPEYMYNTTSLEVVWQKLDETAESTKDVYSIRAIASFVNRPYPSSNSNS